MAEPSLCQYSLVQPALAPEQEMPRSSSRSAVGPIRPAAMAGSRDHRAFSPIILCAAALLLGFVLGTGSLLCNGSWPSLWLRIKLENEIGDDGPVLGLLFLFCSIYQAS
jgi:hypothetical protein